MNEIFLIVPWRMPPVCKQPLWDRSIEDPDRLEFWELPDACTDSCSGMPECRLLSGESLAAYGIVSPMMPLKRKIFDPEEFQAMNAGICVKQVWRFPMIEDSGALDIYHLIRENVTPELYHAGKAGTCGEVSLDFLGKWINLWGGSFYNPDEQHIADLLMAIKYSQWRLSPEMKPETLFRYPVCYFLVRLFGGNVPSAMDAYGGIVEAVQREISLEQGRQFMMGIYKMCRQVCVTTFVPDKG